MRLKLFFISINLILIIGCEKSEIDDMGKASFGINTHIINCVTTTKVYVDNKEVGIIKGFCDTIIDCSSENTLNIELKTGKHDFRFEVSGENGSCFREKLGDFEIE